MTEQMSEVQMQAILSQTAKEFTEAKTFNNWLPPVGLWDFILVSVDRGIKTDNNSSYAYWSVTGRVMSESSPEIDGKEFSLFLSTKALGTLKSAVSVLAGSPINDIQQVDGIITQNIGSMARLKVTQSKSKKNGNTYTNADIVEVLERQQATPTATA